ncbi:PMEI domain-containing protein [Heracleum sosnowskyi]|uniref:PMEI domain-containing protein n=1 Tax=Heracleum sosnowskyi TaxID=360622 RepID=A0AAD8J9J7_9APIA|nr:PMEI domain-containing protein [Heracleum sosnowskyi]
MTSSSKNITSAKTCVLLIIFLNFCIYSSLAINYGADKASTEFIKTSCSITSFPSLCFTSLSSHTSAIQTSSRLLAQTSLSVALNHVVLTSAALLKLSKAPGIKPGEVGPMNDCLEELTDSIDELKRSMGEMSELNGSPKYELLISDIQTWVSAALTDEDTCMDGFAAKAGNTKNVVRGRILNVVHLTSNALSLINNYNSLHG